MFFSPKAVTNIGITLIAPLYVRYLLSYFRWPKAIIRRNLSFISLFLVATLLLVFTMHNDNLWRKSSLVLSSVPAVLPAIHSLILIGNLIIFFRIRRRQVYPHEIASAIIGKAFTPIVLCDKSFVVLHANEQAKQLFSRHQKQLEGRSLLSFLEPGLTTYQVISTERWENDQAVFHWKLLSATGDLVSVQVSAIFMGDKYGDGHGYAVLLRDEDAVTREMNNVRTLENRLSELQAEICRLQETLASKIKEVGEVHHCFSRLTNEHNSIEESILAVIESRDTVVGELHERVSGNMDVIANLLHIASEKADTTDVRKMMHSLTSRIEVLSMITKHIYFEKGYSQVDIKGFSLDIIAGIKVRMEHASFVSMQIDIEDRSLIIEKALPLGLILNELLINCYQHAFGIIEQSLSSTDGFMIEISAREWGGVYKLKVSDNGKGTDISELKRTDRQGGFLLSETLTCEQLNGTIDVAPTPGGGTTFIVNFPMNDSD